VSVAQNKTKCAKGGVVNSGDSNMRYIRNAVSLSLEGTGSPFSGFNCEQMALHRSNCYNCVKVKTDLSDTYLIEHRIVPGGMAMRQPLQAIY
jgi:hypothetical protein